MQTFVVYLAILWISTLGGYIWILALINKYIPTLQMSQDQWWPPSSLSYIHGSWLVPDLAKDILTDRKLKYTFFLGNVIVLSIWDKKYGSTDKVENLHENMVL